MVQNIGKRIDPAEALRKRKWLVILPTLGCVLATGVVSFLLPPVWRVDCLIQSPQIALESPQGTLQVSSFIDLRTTAAQITRGAYLLPLAKDLGLDPKKLPKIEVENIKDTKLMYLWLEHRDVAVARTVLQALAGRLREEFDAALTAEKANLKAQIVLKQNDQALKELELGDLARSAGLKENEIKIKLKDILAFEVEKEKLGQIRASLAAKLKISEAWDERLAQERAAVQKRIESLEELQKSALRENVQADQAALLFLSANVLQQNLQLGTSLDEKLNNETVNRENLRLELNARAKDIEQSEIRIANARTELDSLKNQAETIRQEAEKVRLEMNNLDSLAALLRTKRAVLDSPVFLKEPTPSLDPVAPKKKLNVLIAGLLGLAVFGALALALEAFDKSGAL